MLGFSALCSTASTSVIQIISTIVATTRHTTPPPKERLKRKALTRKSWLDRKEHRVMTGTCQIACIGAGYWGQNLIRNFSDLGVLSWVCELDPTRRAQLASMHPRVKFTDSLDQVLTDPAVSGVAIATP